MKRNQIRTAIITILLALFGWNNHSVAQDSKTDVDPRFQALQYRNVGPTRGGRATAVSGVVGDDQTYCMGGVGGVWKTTDAGSSWNNVTDGFVKTSTVGDIDVSCSHPNHVIVGMGESPFRREMSSHGDGIYLSKNAGKTWEQLGFRDARQISSVKFHPENPDIIWAGVQGDPWKNSFTRGLYKSTDGGKSWKQTLFVNETTGAVAFSAAVPLLKRESPKRRPTPSASKQKHGKAHAHSNLAVMKLGRAVYFMLRRSQPPNLDKTLGQYVQR